MENELEARTVGLQAIVGPTAEMVGSIVTEIKHAQALGRSLDDAVRLALQWECWRGMWQPSTERTARVKTAGEMRMDAAHDTSCVGAFARAKP